MLNACLNTNVLQADLKQPVHNRCVEEVGLL